MTGRNPKNESHMGRIIMTRLKEMERSQAWLSRQAGCAVITISFIVKGRLRPSVELTQKIAQILGIDPEILLSARTERLWHYE